MDTNIFNTAVGTTPVEISAAKRRKKIAIVNHGADTVWMANSQGYCVADGAKAFPIASGIMIELEGNASFWCVCDTGDSSSVAILEELV